MQFIYPEFLFALSALSIPIIIHLFNFRRFKKIYFTNVRFLKEIKQDTQSRSKLKHLLILLSRLLAITFLVLAFAQPFIPVNKSAAIVGSKRVSIYVDNSFSMDALSTAGNLIEVAKKKAIEIANAYKPSDEFQLLTSSFEGRHQRLVNRDEFISLVDEIKVTSTVHAISEVIERQQDALYSDNKSSIGKSAFVISDFQKSVSDIQNIKADSTLQISLVPINAASVNNIYIDTCYLSTPFVQLNTPNELIVRIKNLSTTDAENIPLKLTINSAQKAVASVSIASNTFTDVKMTFTLAETGWQRGELSLTDYPITFDDHFYFNFNIRTNLNILCINNNEPSSTFSAVFGNDPYFNLKNSNSGQIDYASFSGMNLIVLNELTTFSSGLIQELNKYIKKGGSVFIIPSKDATLSTYNELLKDNEFETLGSKINAQEKVSKLQSKHPLFTGVFEKGKTLPDNIDLPIINSYYQISKSSKSKSDIVMQLSSGNAYLAAGNSGKGNIYLLAGSLQKDDGNFARHALFVPILIRAALQGSAEILHPLTIGNDEDFSISDTLISADNVFHLINEKEKIDIIPESKIINNNSVLSVHDQIKNAGNYDLKTGSTLVSIISFNYNRKESDLNVYTIDDLEKQTSSLQNSKINIINSEGKDLSHSISQLNDGKRLWKYCVILTLLFLACEVLLIRYFRK